MKKDIWFNIMMLMASVFILLGHLNKESGGAFELIKLMGYLLLFSALGRDSYISYRKEKSKRDLIELCFHGFCIVLFLFGYFIE